MNGLRQTIVVLLAASALSVPRVSAATVATPATAEATAISFTTFAELRAYILDAISGASERIWLSSDYLTDGEIVSALYVARYRKLDVQVLLGRTKANFYMSRLAYLKNQNIPVFLQPPSFAEQATQSPTAVLVDAVLIRVDSDLDFLSKAKAFSAKVALQPDAKAYAQAYSAAIDQKVPAVAQQTPAVGRPGRYNNAYVPADAPRPSGGVSPPRPAAPQFTLPIPTGRSSGGADASGAYTYGRAKTPKPEDVPAKLPSATIWQKRAQSPDKPGAAEKLIKSEKSTATPPAATP